jgi:hypothetical protein
MRVREINERSACFLLENRSVIFANKIGSEYLLSEINDRRIGKASSLMFYTTDMGAFIMFSGWTACTDLACDHNHNKSKVATYKLFGDEHQAIDIILQC